MEWARPRQYQEIGARTEKRVARAKGRRRERAEVVENNDENFAGSIAPVFQAHGLDIPDGPGSDQLPQATQSGIAGAVRGGGQLAQVNEQGSSEPSHRPDTAGTESHALSKKSPIPFGRVLDDDRHLR